MVLSPQDIHDKEFTVKMRGYNIDEVNDFLDQIVKDYQITMKQNNDLKSALNYTQSQLKHYDGMKDSLNQSILVAQNAADKVKRESEVQCAQIVDEANKKAYKILNYAQSKAEKQANEYNSKISKLLVESQSLQKRTEEFREKIQTLIEAQLEFTKNSTWDKLLKSNEEDTKQFQAEYNDQPIEQPQNHQGNEQSESKNLDNQQHSRVESKGNYSNDLDSVVVFYPDGSSKKLNI